MSDECSSRRRTRRGAATERLIVEAAIRFCAETGFDWQMRELAKRLGLSHTAIYRHFPSKDALVERVYTEVFESRWNSDWASLIADRTRPMHDRLRDFYLAYSASILHFEWVRIFVAAGLKGYCLPERYLSAVRERVILPAAAELAETFPGLENPEEALWSLHGSIFYLGIRKYVYGLSINVDAQTAVHDAVSRFMAGLPTPDAVTPDNSSM